MHHDKTLVDLPFVNNDTYNTATATPELRFVTLANRSPLVLEPSEHDQTSGD